MASLCRQMFLSKMLNIESEYFAQYPVNSGVKQALLRMKNCYSNNLNDIKARMPNSSGVFQEYLNNSDEKIHAIANIIEKLSLLEEDKVLALETEFNNLIKVDYYG